MPLQGNTAEELERLGLVRVPPGHSLAIHSPPTRPIALGRRIQLSEQDGVEALRQAVAGAPELRGLVDAHLDTFLRLFPEAHWRSVCEGGAVVVPRIGNHSDVFYLESLLQLTAELKELAGYPGFDQLLDGFRNPAQILSTVFEVQAAAWCRARELTTGLEFSPRVARGGHDKRPDFLWKTELGDIVCECKQANEFEAEYRAAYDRMFSLLGSELASRVPDSALRLDVWARLGGGGLEALLRDLVKTALGRWHPGRVKWDRDDRLAAILRPRSQALPALAETAIGFPQQVSDRERTAGPSESAFSLALDLERHRRTIAAKLLRDARRQLPENAPGAVFLGLGGLEAGAAKVSELLLHRTYRRTPFVCVVAMGQVRLISRNGQPFDGRLSAPLRLSPLSRPWRLVRAPSRRSLAFLLGRTQPREKQV